MRADELGPIKGPVARVTLSNGSIALIDAMDAERVLKFRWFASVRKRKDGTLQTYAFKSERRYGDEESQHVTNQARAIRQPEMIVPQVAYEVLRAMMGAGEP